MSNTVTVNNQPPFFICLLLPLLSFRFCFYFTFVFCTWLCFVCFVVAAVFGFVHLSLFWVFFFCFFVFLIDCLCWSLIVDQLYKAKACLASAS